MEDLKSKLVLGTVQFGLDYGVNNFSGKPEREKSIEILNFAYEKGIKTFDTAATYGDAEEVLGEFSRKNNLRGKIKIITKLSPSASPENIEYDIKESLKKLNASSIDGYLLHNPEHLKDKKILKALLKVKLLGLAKNIGVSVYEKSDALYAASLKEIDYIQIPYNIFDQRLEKTDFFQLAKNNNHKIFARSPFLQGLFLMEKGKIPSYLDKAKIYLETLDKIIENYSLSRSQAAFLFSLKNPNIDYVVFGVDNINQLKENLKIALSNVNFKNCMKELKKEFVDVDRKIISPNLWKK